jgi:hypothetical protein
MAEAEGFEPPVPCDTSVFKTGALSRSATPPLVGSVAIELVVGQSRSLFPLRKCGASLGLGTE